MGTILNKFCKRKNILSVMLIFVLFFIIIQVDIRDIFSHGYFTDSVKYEDIYQDDIQGYIDIPEQGYTVTFMPIKNHFAGFVLYLANQPGGKNEGIIELNVFDTNGRKIDTVDVDLSKVQNLDDYKVYTNKSLKKGVIYSVVISIKECATVPNMILVDQDYITEECTDNNLLFGYAYEEPTFTSEEKLFITIFAISFFLIAFSALQNKEGIYKIVYSVGIWGVLVTIMAWNFSFKSFDNKNTVKGFDKFSEGLVTSTIKAEQDESWDCITANLNGYTDITGDFYDYDPFFLTDLNWTKGYSNTKPSILLRTSEYVTDMAVEGNSILFANGEIFKIIDTMSDETWTTVVLDAERLLNYWKYGDLSKLRFIDADGNLLPKGYSVGYQSQFGLQGKIFRYLARIFEIDFLKALCALCTAVTLVMIVFLLKNKYNVLFAGIFYLVFLLGPWIVNVADNLYWVEFTWFFPMVAGLLCAWKIDRRKYRVFSYILAYVTILIKSLCGYEYISVVMMGLIAFLLVDFIMCIVNKNKKRSLLIFRTIFIIGIIALLGFFTALCIHAPQKAGADGNVIEGIRLIIQNDVIRRTYGADINNFDTMNGAERYAILASTWEVFCAYFHFTTEIITGIGGNLYPLLCITPMLIFIYEKRKNKLNLELVVMYCVFFVVTITWFILAKSHSYVHTHLNYVLWYFGYIQVCIYIIVNRLVNTIKHIEMKNGVE